MKLNPEFLDLCATLAAQLDAAPEFHFFVGWAWGVTKVHVEKCIARVLPTASVYPPSDYRTYIARLNECDMFLSPFPFGNTNSIVDAVLLGIPGVCLDGNEVHSHIDAELFRRLSMPSWLVSRTVTEYRAAATRLASEHDTRWKVSEDLIKTDPGSILFGGDASKFCDAIWWLYKHHEQLQTQDEKVVMPPSK